MRELLGKLLQIPYTFVLMNGAVVAGLFYFARGHQTFWKSVQIGATPEPLRHT
jgi:hypothetical protein